jgi:hypothetical protein
MKLKKEVETPKYKCDHCGKKMIKPVIITEDVPNEGCSQITNFDTGKVYYIGGETYCSLECLFADIKEGL